MARPRQVSDEQITSATMEVVITRGPTFTLADVGQAVGLSAATVVQRFGTKRGLMLEVTKLWMQLSITRFEQDQAPIDQLIAGLAELSGRTGTPQGVANVNASLHRYLTDAEFRDVIRDGLRDQRNVVSDLLEEAISAGQLQKCDTHAVAGSLQVALFGARQIWAIEPDGPLTDWIKECLRDCLAPWLIVNDDELPA